MCNCYCNKYIHKVTKITALTDIVELEVSNSTNIGSLDCFQLIVCKPLSCSDITVPVPINLILNGTEKVPLVNKYGLPITSDKLPARKKYYGFYVDNVDLGTKYVILLNTPYCKGNA